MDGKRALAIFCIIIAAVSVAAGVWGRDGATIALSSLAVFFSILCFIYCSNTVYRYSAIMSITVLICTVLMVSVASYDSLVDGGVMSGHQWMCVCGIIHGAAIIPLIVMFFFSVAAIFNASFNWVVVPGLGWLVGMSMQLPKSALMLITQYSELEQEIISNTTLVVVMLVNLIMFIAFSLILRSVFKKNRYLITANGLEVMG
ncbi:MAG: hypothetical protein FWG41_01585 [Methanomassiliicoccaceae archaeon]|nr:hypothetical protein [Methanomassiliicoccaceae archaeon]